MEYYTVWVRSLGYRGKAPLTYACDRKLAPGTVVKVQLQRELVLGIVDQAVAKPSFAAKPIDHVFDLPALPASELQLMHWLRQYYETNVGSVASLFLPAELSDKRLGQTPLSDRTVVSKTLASSLPKLTAAQHNVVKSINAADTYVLHGRTGSGKTWIYIDLAQQAVTAGRSVLVLTPEIGLTSQLAASFQAVLGDQVVVLHSQLTPSQRQQIWLQTLRAVKPLIVIGPRSILFSPLHDIGLIVLDEAHEPAYKQEQAPYYHARAVASQLAKLHQASLIIGSATPSINDYFLATERSKQIIRLNELARPTGLPATQVQVVDLKDHGQFATSRQLSQPLVTAVKAALSRGEQSLIYLNRRGTARVVLCENCGWQALCPHCDLPLIYHADSGQFRCHTCGFHQPMRTSCPTCGQPSVIFRSLGTKAVTEEVQRLFPSARVQRFDTDNSKAERLEQHFDAVKDGSIDILVGTQLLAKGLDLPRLSVIGLLQADSSLSVPDFSAQERTYQLISQTLGRVGRGHVAGHAIIQTYHPDSPVLAAAISDNYTSFYNSELAERRQFHFPPYYYLLKLSCRRASYAAAEKAALKLKQSIEANISVVEINGPAPSFHEKLQGKYQCQLVIRSKQRSKLLEVIRLLPPSGWTYDIDPTNLL